MNEELSTCFIIGVSPRSGTNYLFNLLSRHPQCVAGSFGEVALLRHSALLVDYAERVVTTWTDSWVENGIVSVDGLLAKLGNGLAQFLASSTAASAPTVIPPEDSARKKVLLTKTPDVRGLQNFSRLFPENSRAILLVRDGRGVVESGVRSFAWAYEHAMQQWAAAADTFLDVTSGCDGASSPFLLVRYEDLVNDQAAELRRILVFFGLDPEAYDFVSAQSIGVIGSSELRAGGELMHWREIEKPASFDPLRRFDDWPQKRRARFAWVAGKQMRALGYPLDTNQPTGWFSWLWHHVLDLKWRSGQRALSIARPLLWRLLVDIRRNQRQRRQNGQV